MKERKKKLNNSKRVDVMYCLLILVVVVADCWEIEQSIGIDTVNGSNGNEAQEKIHGEENLECDDDNFDGENEEEE